MKRIEKNGEFNELREADAGQLGANYSNYSKVSLAARDGLALS